MKRPVLNMVPASVTNHTKPLSGVVCEDTLNLTEVFGLLTLLLGFEEHERELLHAAEGASSSPDTLHETANNLQVIRRSPAAASDRESEELSKSEDITGSPPISSW